MGWREDFWNFDLSRLTFVGWLVFLLLIAAIVVGTYWDSMFSPQPGGDSRRTGPASIAGFGGAVGFFFLAKGLLQLAGVTMVRPKPDQTKLPQEQGND